MADTTNPNALAGTLLTRGKAAAVAVTTGATVDVMVETSGYSTLVVEANLVAGASGDLDVQVNPVAEQGDEVYPLAQPAVQSVGPTLNSGRSYFWGEWDVSAQQRVRIRFTNSNVATKNLDYDWRLA